MNDLNLNSLVEEINSLLPNPVRNDRQLDRSVIRLKSPRINPPAPYRSASLYRADGHRIGRNDRYWKHRRATSPETLYF